MKLEKKILQKFTQHQQTLALAESCTGGLIAHRLTNVPGASGYFLVSVVAYENAAKVKLLRVPPALIKKYGAVSSQVAGSMAQGVRKILKTGYGLAVTGIAGPSGATKKKPLGLVFISLSTPDKTTVQKFLFKGNRASIKAKAAESALKMLAK